MRMNQKAIVDSVAFEFHYRGYLMPALMKTTGPTAALLLQSIPSTLIHLGLPTLELVGSFPGQLFLGWIAWRCGSFWPVVALHAVAGISLDLSILLTGS